VKFRKLLPTPVSAAGRAYGRIHFAAGHRLFALLCMGFLFVPLMFVAHGFGWALLAWNIVVCVLFAIDAAQLPKPDQLIVERSFSRTLDQLQPTAVTLTLDNTSSRDLYCEITDDVPRTLSLLPIVREVKVAARHVTELTYNVIPANRGDSVFARAYLKYESPLRIAQGWAAFDIDQEVRVYPMMRESGQQQALLLRSRQIELQRRMVRQRGHGREFESLRDFQVGDEQRDICWTATARRSKLVTTLRQSERSQTVWAVVDCGRLMRARMEGRSKLDYATETAMRLAQLASFGGDSSAMLAYGQRVQQRRLPGRGNQHLHAMLDQLAVLQEESAEADHLHAAGALLSIQKRRAMIVWITDLADTAITPEVVTAALHANKRHLVVVAVLGQPDVARLTETAPITDQQTYLYAAASETMQRRELMIARLRGRGVHVIEVNAPQLTGAVLNKYLDVKQKNVL
jgi:uncharacterized protein (DUF58 family)